MSKKSSYLFVLFWSYEEVCLCILKLIIWAFCLSGASFVTLFKVKAAENAWLRLVKDVFMVKVNQLCWAQTLVSSVEVYCSVWPSIVCFSGEGSHKWHDSKRSLEVEVVQTNISMQTSSQRREVQLSLLYCICTQSISQEYIVVIAVHTCLESLSVSCSFALVKIYQALQTYM